MSAGLPAALAVAGTALMALAIFGPFHRTGNCAADLPSMRSGSNGSAHWPALVEASAAGCDVPARIDLADALGALGSTWAESILRQALETEAEPAVRSAIAAALSSSQSLVT